MPLTQLQWLYGQRLFKYTVINAWAMVAFLVAFLTKNDAYFFGGMIIMIAGSYQIIFWILDGVDERRTDRKWIYLRDGSAVLIRKDLADQLTGDINRAYNINEPFAFGTIIYEWYLNPEIIRQKDSDITALKNHNDRLQQVIGNAVVGISIAQNDTQLRAVGTKLEDVIIDEFPQTSGLRAAIQERRVQRKVALAERETNEQIV